MTTSKIPTFPDFPGHWEPCNPQRSARVMAEDLRENEMTQVRSKKLGIKVVVVL